MKYFLLKSFGLLMLLVTCLSVSRAGIDPYVSNRLTGTQIQSGGPLYLADPLFPDVNKGCRVKSSVAVVSFGFNYADTLGNDTATYFADVQVSWKDSLGVVQQTDVTTLSINYHSGQGLAALRIPDAFYLEVDIQSTSSTLPDYVFLEASLETERYYALDYAAIPYTSGGLGTNLITSTGELEIYWDHLTGAEQYDLEYVYINDYADTSDITIHRPASNLTWDFKYNSTRVRLIDQFYRVPLVYDRGYLLYRVRAVGRDGVNLDKYAPGRWSSDQFSDSLVSTYTDKYTIDSTWNYNYQSKAAFAEEGKRKDVLNYFDGSARSRQTVTRMNTTDQMIIGESVYDYQGRPVVHILPVPVVDTSLIQNFSYHEKFNVNTAGNAYSRTDFDTGASCTVITAPMDSTKGASLYYSLNNPDQSGVNAYIPSAQGYPFSQTEYEPDKTGRIRRQSGVGKTHKLSDNATGYETHYYYGQPEQEQLDRLLGNSAGYAGHYKKNMVVDPNGQISVSYIDLNGKTVASALAGDKPDHADMDYIGPADSTMLTVTAIRVCPDTFPGCNVNNTLSDSSLILAKEFLVTSDGLYSFSYTVTPAELNYFCYDTLTGDSSQVCYDCIYTLEISIRDECGKLITQQSGGQALINTSIGTLSDLTSCSNNNTSESLTCTLTVGAYTLYKKLTINPTAVNAYFEDRVVHCLKTLNEFKSEQSSKSSFTSTCKQIDCQSCLLSLSYIDGQSDSVNYNAYKTTVEVPMSFGQYRAAVNACQEMCNPVSNCDESYQMMLSDVSPAGQYAALDSSDAGWDLSIFNYNNWLPQGRHYNASQAYWKEPFGDYKNEDSTVAYVVLTALKDTPMTGSDFFPPISDIITIVMGAYDGYGNFVPNTSGDLYGVKPQYLANQSDFVNNWKDAWADALVIYHPEYCYYEACSTQDDSVSMGSTYYSSRDFDNRLQIIQAFKDADTVQPQTINGQSNPLYDPKFNFALIASDDSDTSANDLINLDPYFVSHSDLKPEMQARLNNYQGSGLNAKQFAARTARCATIYYGTVDTCHFFGYYDNTKSEQENANIRDMEWNGYSAMYLGEKQKIQQKEADQYCLENSEINNKYTSYPGYNGCIGNKDFNPFDPRLIGWNQNGSYWHWYNLFRLRFIDLGICEPCGWYTYSLYANKIKRFTSEDDLKKIGMDNICPLDTIPDISAVQSQAQLEHYLETGQCPMAADLEYFLNQLASDGNFYADSPLLRNYTAFSELLYDTVVFHGNMPTAPYVDLKWYKGTGGTDTTQQFYIDDLSVPVDTEAAVYIAFQGTSYVQYRDTGVNVYTIPLTFDSLPHYYSKQLGDVDSTLITSGDRFLVKFVGFRNLFALNTTGDTNTFQAQGRFEVYDESDPLNPVLIEEINDVPLEGFTDLPINGCDFSRACELSQSAKDLQVLLSAVATDRKLNSTDVNIYDQADSNYYEPLVTGNLKTYMFNPASLYLNSTTGSNSATLNFKEGYDDKLTVQLNTVDPNLTIDFSQMISLCCIRADESTTAPNDFLITASVADTVTKSVQYIDFKGSVTTFSATLNSYYVPPILFNVNDCGPQVPAECKTQENLNRKNLNSFLSSFIRDNPKSAYEGNNVLLPDSVINLYNDKVFMSSLKQYFGKDTVYWHTVKIQDSLLTAEIDTGCQVTLVFLDQPAGITFKDLSEFGQDLKATTDLTTGGKAYSFTVTAVYYDAGVDSFKTTPMSGSSCFPIDNCAQTCIEGRENLVVNGDFSDPTLPKDAGANKTWDTDYTLLQFAGTMGPNHAELTTNTHLVGDWVYLGAPLVDEGFLLAFDQSVDTNDRMWYRQVNVTKGETYTFSCWATGLNTSTATSEEASFRFYYSTDLSSDMNKVKISIGDDSGILDPDSGWVMVERTFIADITATIEIGLVATNPDSAGHDIGIDNIGFYQPCSNTPVNILPTSQDSLIDPCADYLNDLIDLNAQNAYNHYIEQERDKFKADYLARCADPSESLQYTYPEKEYHYTLYYYDQPGNLVQTVPPSGVSPLSTSQLSQVQTNRMSHTFDLNLQPDHSMASVYDYNSLNQLVSENQPDHVPMGAFSSASANSGIPASYSVKQSQFTDASDGWAIAVDTTDANSYGRLLVTHDGGSSWDELNSTGTGDMVALRAIDANKVYAVTSDGVLLRTTDGGDTWVNLPVGTGASPVVALSCQSDTVPLVYTADGTIYKSTTSGATWTVMTALSDILTGSLKHVHFHGPTSADGHAVSSDGVNGYIYYGANKGNIWEQQSNIYGLSYSSLSFYSASEGFLAGQNGTLYQTVDTGQTWKAVPTFNLTTDFSQIHFRNDVTGSAILSTGDAVQTEDGGLHWYSAEYLSETLADMSFVSTTEGYGLAGSGTLYQTLSGGVGWDTLVTASGATFTTVTFTNSSLGYLGGTGGKLFRYQNASLDSVSGLSGNLKDVHFANADTGCVLMSTGTYAGEIMKTEDATDASPVWADITPAGIDHVDKFYFVSSLDGFAYTASGAVLKTTDGCLSWDTLTSTNKTGLSDLYFIDTNTGILVTDSSAILQTTDSGATWTDRSVIIPLGLNGVDQYTTGACRVVGDDGTIYQSDVDSWYPAAVATNKNFQGIAQHLAVGDSGLVCLLIGETWTLQSLPSGVAGTDFFDAGVTTNVGSYVGVGKGGVIVRYSNSSWPQITSGTSQDLIALDFGSSTTGFIVGNSGTILKTTDAGLTWTSLDTIKSLELNATCRVPGTSIGFVVGNEGTLMKTTDGGDSWQDLDLGATTDLYGIYFENSLAGVAVGAGGKIYRSTDGGSSWSNISSPVTADLLSVYLSGSTAIAVGKSGTVVISSDMGATWTDKTSQSGTTNDLTSVFLWDANTAYVAGKAGTLLRSTDGGSFWDLLQETPGQNWTTADLNRIYFTDAVTGYAVGAGGTFLKTLNKGDTWLSEDAGTTNNLNDITPLGDGRTVVSGNAATVSTVSDQSDRVSVKHWYDELGRAIISQDSKQYNESPKAYTYSVFDNLNRIVEVGKINQDTVPSTSSQKAYADFTTWLNGGKKSQITKTTYDYVKAAVPGFSQDNLRTRVSRITFQVDSGSAYDHASHFSYDIHGNVQSLLQEVPSLAAVNQRYKRIDYDYDLVSGNVNYVHYQAGQPDAFHHKYEYDADNRITEVYTSSDADAYFWEKDARYFYYPHGPLARAELGDIKVQAVDYAYTIQGWLKGVNSNTLRPRNDIGQDGLVNTVNVRIPADAYGYSLNYFTGDYTPVGGTAKFIASTAALDLSKAGPDLYNGNISSMITTLTSIDPLNDSLLGQPIPQLTAYRYDQLNRIKQLQAYHNINLAGNAWLSSGNDNRYASSYTYDGNGNLQTVNRHDNTGATMDSTTYVYENKANGYDRETNKLRQVKDAISSSQSLEDIDNQDANNYTYDEIGQLAGDVSEGIASVTWFADHKPWKVTRVDTSSLSDLEFKYDASGNRIAKIVKPAASRSDTTTWETTWYVRDANGELLATYDQTDSTFKTSERMLYGSSMLGVNTDAVDMLATPDTSFIGLTVGFKRYHLKNHLGNVNMVVTDKRVFNSDSVFRADVLLTNDFYPFGTIQRGGRSIEANLTQYGFNDKRTDNELGWQDYGDRMYDPLTGRFIKRDGLYRKYPQLSTYQFASNRPIDGIDWDGLEFRKTPGAFAASPSKLGMTKLQKPNSVLTIELTRSSNLHSFYYNTLKIRSLEQLDRQVWLTKTHLDNAGLSDGALANTPKEGAVNLMENLVQMAANKSPEIEAYNDASQQIQHINYSVLIVNNAKGLGLIPEQFENDSKFYAHLTNYVFDGSTPAGYGDKSEAYNGLISHIGKELYDNRQSILNKTYKRRPQSVQLHYPKWNLDRPSPEPSSVEHYGADQVQTLVKQYNEAKSGCVGCSTVQKKH